MNSVDFLIIVVVAISAGLVGWFAGYGENGELGYPLKKENT